MSSVKNGNRNVTKFSDRGHRLSSLKGALSRATYGPDFTSGCERGAVRGTPPQPHRDRGCVDFGGRQVSQRPG